MRTNEFVVSCNDGQFSSIVNSLDFVFTSANSLSSLGFWLGKDKICFFQQTYYLYFLTTLKFSTRPFALVEIACMFY